MSKGLIAPGNHRVDGPAAADLIPQLAQPELCSALPSRPSQSVPWLAIWPTLLYLRSPELFREWFWINNLGRFLGFAKLGPGNDHLHYFKILPWFAWPALPIALWTLWHGGAPSSGKPEPNLRSPPFW